MVSTALERRRTYQPKPQNIERNWVLIDAKGQILGRLAAHISKCIRGKHKVYYAPHVDCGDHVVVVNAEEVVLTGDKRDRKQYHRHSGHPGGLKSKTAKEILEGARPEDVVRDAVRGMLPKNKLARQQAKKLHVYSGPHHPHEAQSPTHVDFSLLNGKNSRGEFGVNNLRKQIKGALDEEINPRLDSLEKEFSEMNNRLETMDTKLNSLKSIEDSNSETNELLKKLINIVSDGSNPKP